MLLFGLLGRVLFILDFLDANPRLITVSEFLLFLFGPSFMLFTTSALYHRGFQKKDLLHFIPGVLHISYLLVQFIGVSDAVLNARFQDGTLFHIVLIMGSLGWVYNVVYWLWTWNILQEFAKELQKELSYAIKLDFFKSFLYLMGLVIILWLVLLLLTINNQQLLPRFYYNFVWLSISIIILFLGFYLISKPEIFEIKMDPPSEKYQHSKLSTSDLERLKSDLVALMLHKKPYLNKKLLKAELAEQIGINAPDMARLLNVGFGMNFFEFVNYYRIKEFVQIVESGKKQNLTFIGIAEEAGFNSKSTFNKAFKDIMGKTPRAYFENSLSQN